jgi:hypothetical protein
MSTFFLFPIFQLIRLSKQVVTFVKYIITYTKQLVIHSKYNIILVYNQILSNNHYHHKQESLTFV